MATQARYGWRPDKPDMRDRRMAVAPVALPRKVSLRSKMPPVFNQGELGSCTANAIAATLEYGEKRQGEHTHRLSRLFIYYNERAMEGTVKEDAGAEIRDGIKSVAKLGASAESLWPYKIEHFAEKPPPPAYAEAVKHEALNYARIDQQAVPLQASLAQGFPVVFGFTVYDSFESAAVAKTGKVPMPNPRERVVGGHAVVLVGYDARGDSLLWEVRNSWGSKWGDKGHAWFSSSYLLGSDLSSDFWVIRLVA